MFFIYILQFVLTPFNLNMSILHDGSKHGCDFILQMNSHNIDYASICLSVNFTLYILQRNLISLHTYVFYIYSRCTCMCICLRWHSHNTVFKMKNNCFCCFNIILNDVFIFFFTPQGKNICQVTLVVYTDAGVLFFSFICLAMLHDLEDLSSPIKDQTWTLGSEGTKS